MGSILVMFSLPFTSNCHWYQYVHIITGGRAVTQFNAPSVTPWRYKLPTKTGEAHNPGIRLIKYNRDTGLNLDYTQYFINITDANRENKSSWVSQCLITSQRKQTYCEVSVK